MQPPDDLDWHLRVLTDPHGGEPHVRERQRSLDYLLAHADHAHPRLLDALRTNPDALDVPALVEVLPAFARPESIAVLESLLSSSRERTVEAASMALGRHPATAARDALLRALTSASAAIVGAAADGLWARRDATTCAPLLSLVSYPDADTRYRVVRAAGALGCMSRPILDDLHARETDVAVRELLRQLRAERG